MGYPSKLWYSRFHFKLLFRQEVKCAAKNHIPSLTSTLFHGNIANSLCWETNLVRIMFFIQSFHLCQGLGHKGYTDFVFLDVRRNESNCWKCFRLFQLTFLHLSLLLLRLLWLFLSGIRFFRNLFLLSFTTGRTPPPGHVKASHADLCKGKGHHSCKLCMFVVTYSNDSEDKEITTLSFPFVKVSTSKTAATLSGITTQGFDVPSAFHVPVLPSSEDNSRHRKATVWFMLMPTVDSLGILEFFQMETTMARTATRSPLDLASLALAFLGTSTTTTLPCLT